MYSVCVLGCTPFALFLLTNFITYIKRKVLGLAEFTEHTTLAFKYYLHSTSSLFHFLKNLYFYCGMTFFYLSCLQVDLIRIIIFLQYIL